MDRIFKATSPELTEIFEQREKTLKEGHDKIRELCKQWNPKRTAFSEMSCSFHVEFEENPDKKLFLKSGKRTEPWYHPRRQKPLHQEFVQIERSIITIGNVERLLKYDIFGGSEQLTISHINCQKLDGVWYFATHDKFKGSKHCERVSDVDYEKALSDSNKRKKRKKVS